MSLEQPTPLTVQGGPADLTDHSSTSTGADQVLMAANPNRKGWKLQNNAASADMWYNATGGAASAGGAGCYKVKAGDSFYCPIGGATKSAIHIFCGTAAQGFAAAEW